MVLNNLFPLLYDTHFIISSEQGDLSVCETKTTTASTSNKHTASANSNSKTKQKKERKSKKSTICKKKTTIKQK